MEFVVEPPAPPFLDRLRATIRSTGSWAADDRWDDDHLIEQVRCCPLGGKLSDLEIELTLRWNPDGSFENLQILPTQAVDGWEEPVRQLLIEIAHKAETQPSAFQTRHRFAYIGRALDGEYFLDDIRVAPVELPDEPGVNVERVVIIDSRNTGVDVSQAHAVGYDRANDVIGLLTVLLRIGPYVIRPERRWVVKDGRYERRQMGHSPPSAPLGMPEPGELCSPGQWDSTSVSTFQLFLPLQGELRLPADTPELLRILSELTETDMGKYRGALRLVRLGNSAGKWLPSVQMSYLIAAVDALNPNREGSQGGFNATVERFCPELLGFAKGERLYGRFRSAHFHNGVFRAGEYQSSEPGPFPGPQSRDLRMSIPLKVQALSSTILIRWLLSKKISETA